MRIHVLCGCLGGSMFCLVVCQDPREQLILSLKREIKILRQENHYLRQQVTLPCINIHLFHSIIVIHG